MGGTIPSAPMDYRTERTMKKFNIPQDKIQALWVIFCKHDRSASGYLTKDEFFNHIIHYRQTVLTDHMFKLIESKSDNAISFGEFVEIVVTFSCFEKKELMRYFFYILDRNRSGIIDKTELKHFVSNMWEKELLTNVTDGLTYLDEIDDGDNAFNFAQIEDMQQRYPLVMYPLYRLQASIIEHTLGEYFWENHKAKLIDQRTETLLEQEKALKLRRKMEVKSKELVSEEMVKQRMGYKYYLFPWMRGIEKARMLRIAALEQELDKTYSTRYTRGEIKV